MKKRVFIVHGWGGSSTTEWIPWAVEALEKTGVKVVALNMPHPEKPEIHEWVNYLASTVGKVDENTYFIGHSIGCQTILRFLETIDTKIGGVVFVAGWFNLLNLESKEAEAIAEPWITTPIDLSKVRKNLPTSVVFLGDNDPWVPYAETKHEFEEKLGSKVVTVPGGGHITSDDGFGPLPLLLETFQTNF